MYFYRVDPIKDIPATATCPYCPKTETSEETGLEYDVSYDYETLLEHIRKAHQYLMIDFRSTKHPIQDTDPNSISFIAVVKKLTGERAVFWSMDP